MLSNLASYLGYQLAPAELEPDVAEAVHLSAVEEDEWLLVERQDLQDQQDLGTTTTASSALPGARPMQESWYITPPPSFTSRGPVHMETSPLENLLIEHPSMSVYQKSGKTTTMRRKTSNSSRSASEEDSPALKPPSEEGSPIKRKDRVPKHLKNKYSKKTSTKRLPASSSDEAISLPSASDDELQESSKDVKVKNFVKSPRRSVVVKSLARKPSSSSSSAVRRQDTSSSDEMISIPSNNEDDSPKLSSLAIHGNDQAPKMLYSDVLRTKPKPAVVVPIELRSGRQPAVEFTPPATPIPPAVVVPAVPSAALGEEQSAAERAFAEALMIMREDAKDRRRVVQASLPDEHRQNLLNRSAQKVEQRKTCELAKRSTMGRNNKAREMNSRNKRQRRSDMMQRHSGANNNRKCC